MPNGHDKNWIRLCGALDGFFLRHGSWPTRIKLERAPFDDLRSGLFTRKSWLKLQTRITFVVVEQASFVAEGASGQTYTYGTSGVPGESPTQSAEAWLGVAPDRSPEDTKDPDFDLVFRKLFEEGAVRGEDLPWWASLDGEVKQGRPEGRYLEQTLEAAMSPDYRTLPKEQFFFSSHKRSCMDGRFGAIAVEEKVIHLNFAGVRDGAICRSLVWVLGNPLALTDPLGALGLCVVKEGRPLPADLAASLFRVIGAIRGAGVELAFIHGGDGRRWPEQPGGAEPPPDWLAVAAASSSFALPDFTSEDVARAERLTGLQVTEPLFGHRDTWASVPGDDSVAYAEWSNHWQMLDIGLLLRARGFRAVKVKYTGPEVHVAGHGVELRVQRSMRDIFGVVLDWGLPAS
jgi:hypothetical protein